MCFLCQITITFRVRGKNCEIISVLGAEKCYYCSVLEAFKSGSRKYVKAFDVRVVMGMEKA